MTSEQGGCTPDYQRSDLRDCFNIVKHDPFTAVSPFPEHCSRMCIGALRTSLLAMVRPIVIIGEEALKRGARVQNSGSWLPWLTTASWPLKTIMSNVTGQGVGVIQAS